MLRRLLALLVCLGAALLVFWPQPAWAGANTPDGRALFSQHCIGCHINGGNIIRRSKTLKLAALRRNGIKDPRAIATIAADGIGQMGGYGTVLGEGGPEAVAEWVWQQAQAGWPKT